MNINDAPEHELKGHCSSSKIVKFRLAYFHVILPNATKYTT